MDYSWVENSDGKLQGASSSQEEDGFASLIDFGGSSGRPAGAKDILQALVIRPALLSACPLKAVRRRLRQIGKIVARRPNSATHKFALSPLDTETA